MFEFPGENLQGEKDRDQEQVSWGGKGKAHEDQNRGRKVLGSPESAGQELG